MVFKVVLEEIEGEGYSVYCPTLKGCWSQGKTEEEALENIKDAIRTYLKTLEEVTRTKHTHEVEVAV
jgi:predicted RNase H-like HicB family nuclease